MLFPTPSLGTNFYLSVQGWLTVIGGSELRRAEQAGEDLPSSDALADFLFQQALHHGDRYIDFGHKTGNGRLKVGAVEKLVEKQATYLLESFQPAFTRRFTTEQASKGGRKSKRRTKHSLQGLEGLSIAQQAASLGVSLSTISRLRRAATAAENALLDSIAPEYIESQRHAVFRNESEQAIYDEVTAVFEDMGIRRMTNGGWHIPDPERLNVDDVLEGLLDAPPATPPLDSDPVLARLLEDTSI